WHKHGVCNEQLWPKRARGSKRPNPSWQSDAERRPLGAYYRVDARSIADMQAAVHEVNAVYCSARVHEGWLLDRARYSVTVADHPLPVISTRSFEDITGGHAFAVVGYTEDGFIIQNSWGRDWGHQGFGLLTYEDWMRNGDDAWVAAMAARAKLSSSVSSEIPASYSQTQMQLSVSMEALKDDRTGGPGKAWREAKAYEHAVVMGNDGKLLRRLIDTADSTDNLDKVVLETPSRAIEKGAKHVMIYAHGGLNSERAAIERAMRMGPWFEANGIHPVFVVWRTSLLESIGQIGQDFVQTFQKERDELKAESVGDVLDRMIEKLQNKFDKAFEAAAEKVVGKAVWSQMKQNARQAATGKGGSRRIVRALRLLKDRHPGMRLHLVGHSAGSILLGHMLGDMDKALGVDSVSLFAPACSVDFAVTHYGRALNAGTIGKGKLHVDNLSDENERRDTVGPYGKSLLYLVSRAFEDPYKMPLLGFARSWADAKVELRELMREYGADFAESGIRAMHKWAAIADQAGVALKVLKDREVETYRANGDRVQIKAAHGSFDNDLAVMNAALRRMLGGAAPAHEIQDLRGF
ncbi:MAG: C1 family peptidase, partial [Alphaproteobacteria bacterium]